MVRGQDEKGQHHPGLGSTIVFSLDFLRFHNRRLERSSLSPDIRSWAILGQSFLRLGLPVWTVHGLNHSATQ